MARRDIGELLERAGFVFFGRIRRLGAATMASVPVTESTAVVRVEEVVRAPDAVGDQTGREITVELRTPRIKPKGRALFFTEGLSFGESIAVREIGRVRTKDPGRLRKEVDELMERRAGQALERRVAGSDLIVVGRIGAMRPIGRADEKRSRSEHDPDWWEAAIEAESVERGRHDLRKPVPLIFPNSRDVMWYQAPKPSPGQDGVWLLRRPQIEELPEEAYTALDPLDYQPRDQLDRVREAIERRGG